MGANTAGIYGAQIFRQDDRPFYRRGFAVAIAVLVVGLLMAVVRFVDDRIRRKKVLQAGFLEPEGGISGTGSDRNSQVDEKGKSGETGEALAPRPSDVQPQPIMIEQGLTPVVSKTVQS